MNKTSNLRRQFKMVLNRLFTISFDSGDHSRYHDKEEGWKITIKKS